MDYNYEDLEQMSIEELKAALEWAEQQVEDYQS